MTLHPDQADDFATLRPALLRLAYRMVGTVGDAEDLVQDAYLRYAQAIERGTTIDSPKAFLTTIITRLAIDHLRSGRVRREEYSGLWLPEPVLTDSGDFAGDTDEDSLSMAFLLLLERLNPVERAVLVLHDVFDYTHGEIAAIVGKTEENCRRIAVRAHDAIRAQRSRFRAARADRERLAERFLGAVRTGELDTLVAMLASDAVVYGDGGGKVPQWTRPIEGAGNVARLLVGMGSKIAELGGIIEVREVNGDAGAVVRDAQGGVVSVFALETANGQVVAMRSVVNPEKLGHIGRDDNRVLGVAQPRHVMDRLPDCHGLRTASISCPFVSPKAAL
jgi:RNA polymerase sigma-70 factor (ECF subfamily)